MKAERGVLYFHMNKLLEAIEDLDSFLREQPNDPEMLRSRGLLLQMMDKYEESLADFNRSIELSPEAETFSARGTTLMHLKRQEEALNDMNKTLELEPTHLTTMLNRAAVFMGMQDFKEALKNFVKYFEDPRCNSDWKTKQQAIEMAEYCDTMLQAKDNQNNNNV